MDVNRFLFFLTSAKKEKSKKQIVEIEVEEKSEAEGEIYFFVVAGERFQHRENEEEMLWKKAVPTDKER